MRKQDNNSAIQGQKTTTVGVQLKRVRVLPSKHCFWLHFLRGRSDIFFATHPFRGIIIIIRKSLMGGTADSMKLFRGDNVSLLRRLVFEAATYSAQHFITTLQQTIEPYITTLEYTIQHAVHCFTTEDYTSLHYYTTVTIQQYIASLQQPIQHFIITLQ